MTPEATSEALSATAGSPSRADVRDRSSRVALVCGVSVPPARFAIVPSNPGAGFEMRCGNALSPST